MRWKLVNPPDEELVVIASALVGLLLYWRLWLLVFHIAAPDPTICLDDFLPYYGKTFIFALIVGLALGVVLPGKPVLAWVFLVIPSFIARYAMCMGGRDQNLLPPILVADAISTLVVLLAVFAGSKNSP